jgi:hypothetical protein
MGSSDIGGVESGDPTLEYGSPLARIGANLRMLVQRVMRGLDPRIYLLRKKVFAKMDGLPGQARQ